ncbi:MAG: hypothetical protein FJ087_20215 [Deltaproteobacteria bacterium]|nr:hypothetical protein [Deltaproteobacteria bacterium]
MKTTTAWTVLGAVAMLAACRGNPVKEDVTAFETAAKALLGRVNEAREALSSEARQTRGGTEADLKAAGTAVKDKVLPKLDAVLKDLDALPIRTPEVQALARKLGHALRLEREYFAGTADALESGDQAAMGSAKKKSQAAATAIEEWETDLKNLGGLHGLRL